MNATLPRLPQGSVVTVGSFDGLHLGHRAVLDLVVSRARAAGRAAVLVTFEPHPAAVVRPGQAPPRLTLGPEREEVLAQAGLDYALFLRFDREMAGWSPERFVREVLVTRCRCQELVIGPDHAFGHDRQGGEATLRRLGAEHGFSVDVVPPVEVAGGPVSSTRIRRLVAEGRLAAAAECLGRPYAVSGMVQAGAARGRAIGVPTANLAVPEGKQLPPDGVYAVRVEWAGGVAGGMLNQGGRPTFGEGARLLEAHLFGVDADLYGRMIRVTWVARLRDVQRFDSVEALREQLGRDRRDALAALAAAPAAQGHNRV